jgi:membrane protein implicated in regulation of membrane protease activity
VFAQPAVAQDAPPLPNLPNSAEIQLKVQRDGSLSVIEAVSVPTGTTMTRHVPLKVPAPDNRDRIFGIRDVVIEGAGTGEVSADQFTVYLLGGTSIVRYTVDGAVDAAGRVSWEVAGGWDTELKLIRASFAAPRIPDAVDCVAGPPGAAVPCGSAQIDHAGLTRFAQQNLPAGQRMDITVELPAGTVPADARSVPASTVAGAFVLTAPVGWAWSAFAVLVLLAAGLLWFTRRRATVVGEPQAVTLTTGEGEDVVFTSPDGVLPGHVGLVLSGRSDAVDLAATVLDLAVRNYLWVSEASRDGVADWRLARRNAADDQLSDVERAVFDALLPEGTDAVLLSELRSAGLRFQTEFHDEVVRRRWLSGRKLASAGVRIIFYGVFLTALLAFTVGYAQLGLIVIVAGVLLAFGARSLPQLTRKGRSLRRRLLGLRAALLDVDGGDVPELERDRLFSRALPYALVLGESQHWVAAFAELDRPLGLYWYDTEAGTPRAGEFAAALVGTFAGTRAGSLRVPRRVDSWLSRS